MLLVLIEILETYRKMISAQRQIDATLFKELTRISDELKKMDNQELSEIISCIQVLRDVFAESSIPCSVKKK